MKKIFIITVLLLLPYVLSGCGTKQTENKTDTASNVQKTVTQVQKQEIQKPVEPKKQLPPPPKLKETYNSVSEYYDDMRKVQLSNESYAISMASDISALKFSTKANYYIKNGKELFQFTKVPDLSKMFGIKNAIPTPAKYLSVNGTTYASEFGDNKTVTVQVPFVLTSEENPELKQTFKVDKSDTEALFNWYYTLKTPGYTPKFTMQQAVYNGFNCRLITFQEKEINSKYISIKEKTEACISDEYGIAVYAGHSVVSSGSSSITNINVNKISVNNVDDSLFKVPNNVIKGEMSTEEFKRLLNE